MEDKTSVFGKAFSALAQFFSLIANVAVVGGVVFAAYTIRQTNEIEKRRVAIDAVSQTRSIEFLKAYRSLKAVNKDRRIDEKEKVLLTDSLNHVMNVYDHIATMYINNVADKCIIKNSTYEGIKEMSVISGNLSYPSEYKKNFNVLLALLDEERCGNQHLADSFKR